MSASLAATPFLAIDTLAPVFAKASANGNQLVLAYLDASTLDAVSAAPANSAFTVGQGVTAIETVGDKVRVDFAVTDSSAFDTGASANGSIDISGGAGQMQLSIIGQPPLLPPGNFLF